MIIRIADGVLNNSDWHPLLDAILAVIEHSGGQHSFDCFQYRNIVQSTWLASQRCSELTSELIRGSAKLANQSIPSDAITLVVDDGAAPCGETVGDQCIRVHPSGALQILAQPFHLIVEDETTDGCFVLWMARILGYDAIRNAYNSGRLIFRHAGGKRQFLKSARALTYGVWPRSAKPIRALRLRAAAMLDSDARFPGDEPNKNIANDICGHVAFIHILKRRSIENYAPEKYFRRRMAKGRLETAADAYFRMSEKQQCYFPLKKGFLAGDKKVLTHQGFIADTNRDKREIELFVNIKGDDWLKLAGGFGERIAVIFCDTSFRCNSNERGILSRSITEELSTFLTEVIRHL